jgi:hypothetical protein
MELQNTQTNQVTELENKIGNGTHFLRSSDRVKWLERAYVMLRDEFVKDAPEEITITTGYPSSGRSRKKNVITGGAFAPEFMQLKDGYTQGLITIPFINFDETLYEDWSAPVQVLSVMIHEMIHASGELDHMGGFSTKCRAVGLLKPWTATTPGPNLIARLEGIAEYLGPIPDGHGDIKPIEKKKQTTRMRKYTCICTPKPAIIRAATDDLDVKCNVCGENFTMEGGDE